MKELLPVVLLAALVSGAVAALVALKVAPSPGPAPVVNETSDLSPLRDLLQDMSRRLDELANRQQGTIREAVQEPDPIEQLPRDLTELVRQASSTGQVVVRDAPINWNALQRFSGLGRDDQLWESARRSVWLLTVPEVVERFGFPDKVQRITDSGGLELAYFRRGPNGELEASLTFNLHGGYVSNFQASNW